MSELDQIVEQLEISEQPATYGAVGGVVGVHHKVVMAGRPRNHRNSWVVNKRTRLPTNYEPHEIHPALSRALQEKPIIETPEDLDEWLAERVEQEWDEQIERDVRAGRLDALMDQALEEHRAGRTPAPMNHYTTAGFWECYGRLPESVRRVADRHYELLRADPRHPSLHFKRVGRLWSVRAGSGYRALAADGPDGPIWSWIGPHDEYERMIAAS